MNLSKAFDIINHGLLTGKLNTYGFDKSSLNLLFSYLNNRWHRKKINQKWFLNDLFSLTECTGVCSFADDTKFFASDKDLHSLIKRLERDSLLAVERVQDYNTKLKILIGIKHCQKKFQRLQKVQIWAFGLLAHQINSL